MDGLVEGKRAGLGKAGNYEFRQAGLQVGRRVGGRAGVWEVGWPSGERVAGGPAGGQAGKRRVYDSSLLIDLALKPNKTFKTP